MNNLREADALLIHPRAATSQVVLNRRETVDGPGTGRLLWHSLSSRMGCLLQPSIHGRMLPWRIHIPLGQLRRKQPLKLRVRPPAIPKSLYFAKKGKDKGRGQGAPPDESLPSARLR